MDNGASRQSAEQRIIITQVAPPTNGLGMAGFVLSLVALFLGWIPFLGWGIWFLGLIFSFIGLFKTPNGFASAGFIISCISFLGMVGLLAIFLSLLK
jgi:hypothetical protein